MWDTQQVRMVDMERTNGVNLDNNSFGLDCLRKPSMVIFIKYGNHRELRPTPTPRFGVKNLGRPGIIMERSATINNKQVL